jgi:hypothetical protein
MHGFLDPAFPNTSTSYMSVLDRMVVGMNAKTAYSFGNSLQQVPVSTRDFESASFYHDSNTRLEDALREIAKDSQARSTHLIITDGRRAGAAAADQQYADLRQRATDWVAHGGTFAVGMSMARFKTVTTDPSGCRQGQGAGPQTCPLYAFAFLARGSESSALAALSDVFEHFFAWPTPTIPGPALRLVMVAGTSPITLNPTWGKTQAGAPIARTTAPSASNVASTMRLELADTSNPAGQMLSRSLAGQNARTTFTIKALVPQPLSSGWLPVNASTSVVSSTQSGDERSLSVISRGSSAPRSLVRVDLVPSGEPSWLPLVRATDAADVVHTFGFDRLFEGFRNQAKNTPTPMARLFLVAN